MALALAYVNEVLNQFPCTVVVDEQEWPDLVKALKFTDRPLEDCILGRMRLRWAPGGYEGVLKQLADATQQVETLQASVHRLTMEVEAAQETNRQVALFHTAPDAPAAA